MEPNQVAKPDVLFTEAAASWNTRYVTPQGFVCQITIRGDNGKDLLEKANIALNFLTQHGYLPDSGNRRNGKGEVRMCPIHQCEMRRYEKDGKSWYSHKLEDGKWCRGKK